MEIDWKDLKKVIGEAKEHFRPYYNSKCVGINLNIENNSITADFTFMDKSTKECFEFNAIKIV